MKKLINSLIDRIGQSILSTNKNSSPIIQSYLILVPIFLMAFTFLLIEVFAFAHSIYLGSSYEISTEIILVFGMLLSHNLALIFSRKTTQPINKILGSDINQKKIEEEIEKEA